jgi:RHS repeat-associated protein
MIDVVDCRLSGQPMSYTAFGEVRAETGASPTDYTYTGQRSYTDDFGLMFYNARWYDPDTAHFAQADTIIPQPGNSADWNRYAYVRNNPIKYIDPTGHDPKCGPDGAFCDNDPWNDFYYDYDVRLNSHGTKIVSIAYEIERLTGKTVSLNFVVQLIFEREFSGWGWHVAADQIINANSEAAVRNFRQWVLEEYPNNVNSLTAFVNWLGEHHQAASSIITDLFINIPSGKKSVDIVLGSNRYFAANAKYARMLTHNKFFYPPVGWATFDTNAPYAYGFCNDLGCRIATSKIGVFKELSDTLIKGINPIFSTNLTELYFKSGDSFIVTHYQWKNYWGKE